MFPQLTKEYEQLPKEMGLTVTLNSINIVNESDLLMLLSEYQTPVIL
jgi:hypothetical protein